MRCATSLVFHLATAMWRGIFLPSGLSTAFTPTKRIQRQISLRVASSSSTAFSSAGILPRVKAVDAKAPTDGPVAIKGWVRTVRIQKTVAFVEVNDGSNLAGIQVVAALDAIDDDTKKGK